MSSELEEAVAQDQRLKNIFEFTNTLRQEVSSHSHSSSNAPSIPTPPPLTLPNTRMTLARNQTLKELVFLTLDQQPLCIDMPPIRSSL